MEVCDQNSLAIASAMAWCTQLGTGSASMVRRRKHGGQAVSYHHRHTAPRHSGGSQESQQQFATQILCIGILWPCHGVHVGFSGAQSGQKSSETSSQPESKKAKTEFATRSKLGKRKHTPPFSSEELSLPKKMGATEDEFRWWIWLSWFL